MSERTQIAHLNVEKISAIYEYASKNTASASPEDLEFIEETLYFWRDIERFWSSQIHLIPTQTERVQ